MKKSAVYVFIIIFLILPFCLANAEEHSKIDRRVLENIENGDIRVLVHLKNSHALSVSSESRSLMNDLGTKVRHNYGNDFSADISKQDLEILEQNENVEGVRIIEKRSILLQDTTRIVNVTGIWPTNYSGLNLTGAGQTVCIIDTGANYTHPDLGGALGVKVIGGYDFTNSDNDPMDDNGHGTHVAGIIAASGNITGIAPDAKIVALKACTGAGVCYDDDINKSIGWCVDNATIFNITVISLSLGGGNFSGYCDYNETDTENITLSINRAVARNISVVIASGNLANYTAIAFPACIQNATPVSATDKSDNVYTGFSRNSIVQLMAPGISINSTNLSNKYAIMSGTSMATPHVSGAIIILNQFLKLTGRTKTTQQVESILNSTGKQVVDSQSGLSFSRINVYNAIYTMSYDYASLVSPSNNLLTNQNQTFSCNASSPVNLSLVTFYLWNSTGIENTSSKAVSGMFNLTNFSYNFTHIGSYKWNCLFTNNLSFQKSQDSNFSLVFSFDIINPNIQFENQTENSSSLLKRSNIVLNITANDTNFANLTLYLYNSTTLLDVNFTSNSSIFLNYTNLLDGIYFFNATAYDTIGNSNSTETRNVTLDANAPYYTSILVQNFTYGTYQFNSTWNDFSISKVWITVLNANYTASYNSTYAIYNVTLTGISAGNYSFQWFANDSAGSLNSTPIYNFTISQADPALNISFNVSGIKYYKDITVDNGTNVNTTATGSGEGIMALYINNTLVNSGKSLVSNTTSFNESTVNVTAVYASTQNYTGSSLTKWITVELSSAAPKVSKISPANNIYIKSTVVFRINATDASLKNATIILWTSASSIDVNTTNLTGMSNETSWTYALADNNYSWNIKVYDNSNNLNFSASDNYTLTVDSATPAVYLSTVPSPANIYTDESVAITCSASPDMNLNYTVIYIDGSQKNLSYSNQTTYTASGLSAGTKNLNCTAADKAGNMNSTNTTIKAETRTTPPADGPGGGGPTTTSAPAPQVVTPESKEAFANVHENETVIMNLSSEIAKQGLTQIAISPSVNVTNLVVIVKQVSASDISLKAADNVFNYFNISVNLNDSEIKSASINFEVNQSWISSNNLDIDTIRLERYHDGWTELITEKIKEDSDKAYYKAESPGFSLFAITAEKKTSQVITAPAAEVTSSKLWMKIALLCAIFALAIFVYFAFKKPKQ